MSRAKLTLYLDVVSPFAYEAFHVLRNDAIFKNVDITYVPVLLGGLIKMSGNTPPLKIKNKDAWINRERLRWSAHFHIPMSPTIPPNFPALTLNVMRVLCALSTQDDGQTLLVKACEHLWHEGWVRARAVEASEVYEPALKEAVGVEAAEKAIAAGETTGKELLKQNTDTAFAEGAFGLPWMVCENGKGEKEGFWGVDHLGQVVTFLGLEKPKEGGWNSLL